MDIARLYFQRVTTFLECAGSLLRVLWQAPGAGSLEGFWFHPGFEAVDQRRKLMR